MIYWIVGIFLLVLLSSWVLELYSHSKHECGMGCDR